MTTTPISLYLDLEPGQKADLEVVARASLAFAAAIRDIAFVIDPSLEIRIELASGTESSLSLNSLIQTLKKQISDPDTLRTVAVVTMMWFAKETGTYAYDKILDAVTGAQTEVTSPLTDAQAKDIADHVVKALQGKVGKPHVEQVYRELERDRSIRGVGATSKAGQKPVDIVPRSEFSTRSGHEQGHDVTVTKRDNTKEEDLTLISPVLVARDRRWKFLGSGGEFGAVIDDDTFRDNLLSGRISVPMVAGIKMIADVKTFEQFEDGVWKITERRIVKVKTVLPAPPGDHASLLSLLRPGDDDEDDGH